MRRRKPFLNLNLEFRDVPQIIYKGVPKEGQLTEQIGGRH